jgi:hypothetical protein
MRHLPLQKVVSQVFIAWLDAEQNRDASGFFRSNATFSSTRLARTLQRKFLPLSCLNHRLRKHVNAFKNQQNCRHDIAVRYGDPSIGIFCRSFGIRSRFLLGARLLHIQGLSCKLL